MLWSPRQALVLMLKGEREKVTKAEGKIEPAEVQVTNDFSACGYSWRIAGDANHY